MTLDPCVPGSGWLPTAIRRIEADYQRSEEQRRIEARLA